MCVPAVFGVGCTLAAPAVTNSTQATGSKGGSRFLCVRRVCPANRRVVRFRGASVCLVYLCCLSASVCGVCVRFVPRVRAFPFLSHAPRRPSAPRPKIAGGDRRTEAACVNVCEVLRVFTRTGEASAGRTRGVCCRGSWSLAGYAAGGFWAQMRKTQGNSECSWSPRPHN